MTEQYQQFDFATDVKSAIIWRHNDAPNLTALMSAKQAWYAANHEQFWIDWFNNVFSLTSADDFGCAVWAIILNSPVNLNPPAPGPVPWGFGIFNQNFFNANFNPTARNPAFLTTIEKRFVLLLRYWQIVSKGRFVEDNGFLYRLFANPITIIQDGVPTQVWPGMPFKTFPYIVDNLDMTASITLNYPISDNLATIIQEYDLLPRPAGVLLTVTIPTFGDSGGVLLMTVPSPLFPTSDAGLSNGDIWNNGEVMTVFGTTTPNPAAPLIYFVGLTVAELVSAGGANLPLTNAGLAGSLWNNGGVICIV